MNLEVTEEDKVVLKDMHEKFEYFLKKYEGSCINVITTMFYQDGQVRIAPRIELGRIMQKKIISP